MIDNITVIDFIGVATIVLIVLYGRWRFIRWFKAERYDDVRKKIDNHRFH